MVLTLIHNEPPCKRCLQTQDVLDQVAAEIPDVDIESITVEEARAAGVGVVLTPTVLIDGQVLCAGIVPLKSGLLKLLQPN
jgi:predicted thioredoxin/glutaredoxin